MDIINKHYEKIILVVCLLLMIVGLFKVTEVVKVANEEKNKDERSRVNTLDETAGEMVPDFDPATFVSKEGWIQRVKTKRPAPVLEISKVVSGRDATTAAEELMKQWDRRYFSILTRHSRKPIEEAEAKYRLQKNNRELEMLRENIKTIAENIKKRIEETGDDEDDTRLAELRIQLDGYQALLANTEMDIVELNKRVKYISLFCTPQGSLVDPQEVVCCSNENCGALMLSMEDTCPFCGKVMPVVNPAEEDGKDSDMDGLPDSFENAHIQRKGFLTAGVPGQQQVGPNAGMGMEGGMGADGGMGSSRPGVLNPFNAADAHEDFDGDSFSNLEEYRFGTDIDDERSFPDPANYVRLVDFVQDQLPIKFMGINDGRGAPASQKLMKWRAKFDFQRRGRWNPNNEDAWEQIRIGKRFEAPDGKTYVVDDLGEEEVAGKKKAFVKITEYVPPARAPRRAIRRRDAEEEKKEEAPAEPAEPKSYTMYENEDVYYEAWYANLGYFVSRNTNMLDLIQYNRYVVRSGARAVRIQTMFKLEEGATITLQVPVQKKEAEKTEATKQGGRPGFGGRRPPLGHRAGGMGMGGMQPGMNDGMMMEGGDMGMGGGMTSPEVEVISIEYKVTNFNRDKKTLELVRIDAKDAKPFVIKMFKLEETYTLPDGRKYPLLYQGSGGMGMEGGGMMDGPGMMMGPGMRP